MLCDLVQCEYSLPVETGSLNISPVLNSVLDGSLQEITCRQVFFPAPQALQIFRGHQH